MASLKRLAGAVSVSQDDFANGVGTYIVKFGPQAPALPMAAIKKETGSYSINGIELKLTGKVTAKKDKDVEKYYLGAVELVKGASEDPYKKLVELVTAKKTILVVAGVLKEDDKAKQSLELTAAGEPDKPAKK
jgi:hypothetical protein